MLAWAWARESSSCPGCADCVRLVVEVDSASHLFHSPSLDLYCACVDNKNSVITSFFRCPSGRGPSGTKGAQYHHYTRTALITSTSVLQLLPEQSLVYVVV